MNLIFKRYPTLFVLLALMATASCTKTDGGGGGGGGSNTKAAVIGSVVVYDDKGNPNADDKAGVRVELLNGTTVLASTLTTTAGNYTLANVPYGASYILRFSRDDIGTYKMYNISHQYNSANAGASTVISTVQLGMRGTTAITGLSYVGNTYNSLPGASFTLTVSPDPTTNNRAYFRIFVSTNASVSKDDYGVATELRSLISNNATIGFTKDELTILGLTAGQTAYIRVYGDSFQANVYTDADTGKKVYPNLNENTVAAVSFVVP